ncbi:hypothetical protein SLEP1_g36202 [Rubroshorea leprosula]|uniref:Uncharacterized protein n=1 Tax=Rubroshorea leprosula TaxID=152421 RepID=A0AAV5KR89_9ROSI|nr:hypothetical protein SLEP1_g36202 [Rubroshorea leprosula]
MYAVASQLRRLRRKWLTLSSILYLHHRHFTAKIYFLITFSHGKAIFIKPLLFNPLF